MTDFTKNSEHMPKKSDRRNWLRNIAIVVTGAVVLSITGCSKDIQFPCGDDTATNPDTWYNLRALYSYNGKTTDTVYLAGESDWQADPQWYFMKITKSRDEASKFKLHQADAGNGWQWWEVSDGYWLSMMYSGSAYRSGQNNRVAWKITDGKLYTNYNRWKNYPLQSQYFSFLVSPAYYAAVNYGDDKYTLTDCELVPVQ